MKNLSKIFIGLLILSLTISSCKKEDDVTTNDTTPTTSDTGSTDDSTVDVTVSDDTNTDNTSTDNTSTDNTDTKVEVTGSVRSDFYGEYKLIESPFTEITIDATGQRQSIYTTTVNLWNGTLANVLVMSSVLGGQYQSTLTLYTDGTLKINTKIGGFGSGSDKFYEPIVK